MPTKVDDSSSDWKRTCTRISLYNLRLDFRCVQKDARLGEANAPHWSKSLTADCKTEKLMYLLKLQTQTMYVRARDQYNSFVFLRI
jgi:hypothetical protein